MLNHTAYRREVFENAGYFNENLLRTEDNEIHYRIRKAGYKLFCDPNIVSYQYARPSLRKMIKQKYENGYWVGLTFGVCPGCLSLFHFVPFLFVVGIIVTTILLLIGCWYFSAVIWGTYLLFTLAGTVSIVINKGANKWTFLIPILFLLLHLSYGIGTMMGFVMFPVHKELKKN